MDVVRRATATNEENAKARGVRILCQSSSRVPPIVADAELVFQCVSNLVSNAVKFTPNGGHVDVLVHLAGDEGIEIQVSDTGVGIPRALAKDLRALLSGRSVARARGGGTGLRLAIAKHAATVHGGRIEVESAPGRGSRFRVFLPFAPGR